MSAQPKALELADELERRYSGCHADENDFLEMDAAAELRRLHAKVDALECKVDDLEWENKGVAEWRHEWSLMTSEFKNFHRVLCERFGYTHDNIYWRRDQISLVEWIAKQMPAAPVQEFEAWWQSAIKTLDVSDDHDAYIGALAAWKAKASPAAPAQGRQSPATHDPMTVKLKSDWRTDDWGRPIIYDTDEVDNVTHALTGDEGEDDSLTVLNSMANYVSNVWPGKTALQVLIECEEAMIAAKKQKPAVSARMAFEKFCRNHGWPLDTLKNSAGIAPDGRIYADDRVRAAWAWETYRPAAAQSAQRPVGHLLMGPKQDFVTTGKAGDLEINVWHPVYTTPQPQPAQGQEPVSVILSQWKSGAIGATEAVLELFKHYPCDPSITTPRAVQPSAFAVPEGYALIAIDALKSWGKYDEVAALCRYPLVAVPEQKAAQESAYAAPQVTPQVTPQEKQEPVECMCGICKLGKREWVGLTDEDKREYCSQDFGGNRLDAMDWAEARLREKNGGAV